MGCGTNFPHDRPVHRRGGLRSCRCHRARNLDDLREELGDLLFQTVFHSQMAREDGIFDFHDVVEGVTTKMIRRHPHVFGDDDARTQEEQGRAWEEMKAAERAAKGRTSLLDDVPAGLPGLTRAVNCKNAPRALDLTGRPPTTFWTRSGRKPANSPKPWMRKTQIISKKNSVIFFLFWQTCRGI